MSVLDKNKVYVLVPSFISASGCTGKNVLDAIASWFTPTPIKECRAFTMLVVIGISDFPFLCPLNGILMLGVTCPSYVPRPCVIRDSSIFSSAISLIRRCAKLPFLPRFAVMSFAIAPKVDVSYLYNKSRTLGTFASWLLRNLYMLSDFSPSGTCLVATSNVKVSASTNASLVVAR